MPVKFGGSRFQRLSRWAIGPFRPWADAAFLYRRTVCTVFINVPQCAIRRWLNSVTGRRLGNARHIRWRHWHAASDPVTWQSVRSERKRRRLATCRWHRLPWQYFDVLNEAAVTSKWTVSSHGRWQLCVCVCVCVHECRVTELFTCYCCRFTSGCKARVKRVIRQVSPLGLSWRKIVNVFAANFVLHARDILLPQSTDDKWVVSRESSRPHVWFQVSKVITAARELNATRRKRFFFDIQWLIKQTLHTTRFRETDKTSLGAWQTQPIADRLCRALSSWLKICDAAKVWI